MTPEPETVEDLIADSEYAPGRMRSLVEAIYFRQQDFFALPEAVQHHATRLLRDWQGQRRTMAITAPRGGGE